MAREGNNLSLSPGNAYSRRIHFFFNQASSALVCSHNKSYLLAGLSRGGGKSLRYG